MSHQSIIVPIHVYQVLALDLHQVSNPGPVSTITALLSAFYMFLTNLGILQT